MFSSFFWGNAINSRNKSSILVLTSQFYRGGIMPHNDRKKQILTAVEQLAAKKRLYEITLEEVARQAKVGKGTIYRNFSDKDDLLFQLSSSGFDELCALVKQKIPENGPFEQKLLVMCKHINGFFAGRRQLFQIMQSETAQVCRPNGHFRERWAGQRQKLVSAVAEILFEGVRQRLVRSDISTEVLAVFLLGMLRTQGRSLTDAQESGKDHKLLVDLFLTGAGGKREELSEK